MILAQATGALMFAAYLTVAVLAVLANGYAATVDFLQTDQTVAQAERVGAPRPWLLPLGALKAAGAVGILVGVGVPVLGVAAAAGLVLFFIGAIGAHMRVRWYSTIPFPAVFLLLAVGALVLRLATF